MHFVDHCGAKWMLERLISLPVVRTQVSNNALHRGRRVVSGMAGSGAVIVLADGNAFSVWVNQHLVAVKAISVVRLTRTIDAESVELSNRYSWHKDVPVMRSAISYWAEFYDSGRLLGVGVLKEHDLYLRGMG
jgi:hypothetical protein